MTNEQKQGFERLKVANINEYIEVFNHEGVTLYQQKDVHNVRLRTCRNVVGVYKFYDRWILQDELTL